MINCITDLNLKYDILLSVDCLGPIMKTIHHSGALRPLQKLHHYSFRLWYNPLKLWYFVPEFIIVTNKLSR